MLSFLKRDQKPMHPTVTLDRMYMMLSDCYKHVSKLTEDVSNLQCAVENLSHAEDIFREEIDEVVDSLKQMLLEYKGSVSMSRAALSDSTKIRQMHEAMQRLELVAKEAQESKQVNDEEYYEDRPCYSKETPVKTIKKVTPKKATRKK